MEQPPINCPCMNPPLNHMNFDSQVLGVDPTKGRYADVSLETCKTCNRKWLCYYIEGVYSHSGRWYRGLITEETAETVTPETAEEILRELKWHIIGGSYFDSTGKIRNIPDLLGIDSP